MGINIPYPLIADIAKGRCLPFVGAGFSKNASLPKSVSMPDWAELAAILSRDAGTPPNTKAITVAQRYEQRFGRVQLVETIRDALHVEKARPGNAHRAFVTLPFDTIYTTNFDTLLEDAYSDAKRPFRSLVGELQLPFHAGRTASNIVKMHGDLRHEEHMIVTENDYNNFMDNYPIIATHLGAMLITRTPLFIGYSLSDPDFQNIRKIVRSRLGAFERMGYVIQFDVPQNKIEEALDERLHIISLNSKIAGSRDEVLATFLEELQQQLDTKAAVNFRSSRPDLFEEVDTELIKKVVQSPQQSPVIETTSKLCFVIMPLSKKFDEVYRLLIAPAVQDNGLTVLRADEMAGPGFIMEQIRSAIQQSRLCIADVTGSNPNVLYELGYAQAVGKPLLLIAEEGSRLPVDLAYWDAIRYGLNLQDAKDELRETILFVLARNRLEEATRLLDLGMYRPAIAASAIVLEQMLRMALSKRNYKDARYMGLGQMLKIARQRKIVPEHITTQLFDVIGLRNRAVHELAEPNKEQAVFVLSAIREALDILPMKI